MAARTAYSDSTVRLWLGTGAVGSVLFATGLMIRITGTETGVADAAIIAADCTATGTLVTVNGILMLLTNVTDRPTGVQVTTGTMTFSLIRLTGLVTQTSPTTRRIA